MMYADILKEIYSNRNLLCQLVIKELKVRYSRPLFGFFWAFLSPLCMAGVFYLIFSVFLKVRVEEAPFILYLMTAVFPWRFFQESINSSTSSLLDSKNLIRESNFPHYLIPVAIVFANLINLLPSLAICAAVSWFILKGLPVFILFLPLVLLIHVLTVIGLSVMFSVLYVRWRDIKYVIEPLLLLLFYLTPGVYSLKLAGEVLAPAAFNAYIFNPLVGLLSLYRVTLLKGACPQIIGAIGIPALIFAPVIFSVVIFTLGIYVYKKNSRRINDYLSY